MPPKMPTWRTFEDAAREVGVGSRTLRRWVAEGRLKAYTIAGDRHRYVDMEELERLRKPRAVTRRR